VVGAQRATDRRRHASWPLAGDEVDEAAVTNVVLGQFEKVQRSKSKWKVVLKDCILTLNGRDYLVRRCTGEMDF
jgi:transcription initiation factor TFIIA large subunit